MPVTQEPSLLRRRWRQLALLACLPILACRSGTGTGPADGGDGAAGPTPPSKVVLIVVDTLRPDHLGCYGYERDTSPNIDRFASGALRFESCRAHAPETRFSVASLLTGFLPHETGVLQHATLPEAVATLPELLAPHGFHTAAVISNYVLRAGKGYDQGFALYDDTMEERELVRRWPERVAAKTTDRAIEILSEHRDERLFLWVVYQDPHGPYAPPEPYADRYDDPSRPDQQVRRNTTLSGRRGIPSYQQLGDSSDYHHYVARYDAEIRYLDDHFQRLLDAIDELGIDHDTLLILTSDHGEGMGEHNYYFAHGEVLYGHQLRVPLLLRHGERLRGVRTDPAQHLDIVPTVLGALGLPAAEHLRGRDLLADGAAAAAARASYAEMSSPLVRNGVRQSLVHDGWKLIHTERTGRCQLYDLGADPGEEHDLGRDPAQQQRLDDLKARLHRLRDEDLLQVDAAEAAPLSDDERDKLESLGYVR